MRWMHNFESAARGNDFWSWVLFDVVEIKGEAILIVKVILLPPCLDFCVLKLPFTPTSAQGVISSFLCPLHHTLLQHGEDDWCGINGRSACTASPESLFLSRGLTAILSMVNNKLSHRPTICYRAIQPSDLEALQRIHADVFPIRYEPEFFQNVVNQHDIVSWAAVDRSRPNGQSDEVIGFVTARIVLAKESEMGDLLRYDPLKPDQTLVYILTLGVVETYRNLGIASSLIREVTKYASSIPTCRGAYLHVISYNIAAIHLYKKMSFKCVRRLQGFYLINGQRYDSYLFVYYVNGGRSPCSPLELVAAAVGYVRSGLKSVASRLKKNEEKMSKWPKCKESHSFVPMQQSKRNLTTDCTGYECV